MPTDIEYPTQLDDELEPEISDIYEHESPPMKVIDENRNYRRPARAICSPDVSAVLHRHVLRVAN